MPPKKEEEAHEPTMAQLLLMMQKQIEQQAKTTDAVLKRLDQMENNKNENSNGESSKKNVTGPSWDSIEAGMTEFVYVPDDDLVFENWYDRYEDLFTSENNEMSDESKVRMLMRHMHSDVHKRYRDFIEPKKPTEISFAETIKNMKKLFGAETSLFQRRFQFVNMRMSNMRLDSVKELACEINKACQKAEWSNVKSDHMMTLMFITALDLPKYHDLRIMLLNKLRTKDDTTLSEILEECNNLLTVKADSAVIQRASPAINYVQQGQNGSKREEEPRYRQNPKFQNRERRNSKSNRELSRPCNNCGGLHFDNDCPESSHKCAKCKQFGHADGYCQTATRKARRFQSSQKKSAHLKTVHMDEVESRIYVDTQVNDKSVRFQVDTGSDVTVMSHLVWKKIGKPKLSTSPLQITCANDTKVQTLGQFEARINLNGVEETGNIQVSTTCMTLLGLDFLHKFGFLNSLTTGDGSTTPRMPEPTEDTVVRLVQTTPTPYPWPKSTSPWQRIHLESVKLNEKRSYLIAVDEYSLWPEVYATAAFTVDDSRKSLNEMFSRNDYPETIVIGESSPFNRSEFLKYCETERIELVVNNEAMPKSPPSEAAVEFIEKFQHATSSLKGNQTLDGAIPKFLMAYRSSPNANIQNLSPSEMFTGRKMCQVPSKLRPVEQDLDAARANPQCHAMNLKEDRANESFGFSLSPISASRNVCRDNSVSRTKSHSNKMRKLQKDPCTMLMNLFGLELQANNKVETKVLANLRACKKIFTLPEGDHTDTAASVDHSRRRRGHHRRLRDSSHLPPSFPGSPGQKKWSRGCRRSQLEDADLPTFIDTAEAWTKPTSDSSQEGCHRGRPSPRRLEDRPDAASSPGSLPTETWPARR